MNESPITKLSEFVAKHAERGSCRCGKCIDAPDKEHQPKGHTVDMVFFEVAAKGEPDVEELRQLITNAHKGHFGDLDLLDNKEHGYMEVGGWIGDQGIAMMLMGLGKILGLWSIMTPKMLPGLTDEMIEQMAGMGMISIVPGKPQEKEKTNVG